MKEPDDYCAYHGIFFDKDCSLCLSMKYRNLFTKQKEGNEK